MVAISGANNPLPSSDLSESNSSMTEDWRKLTLEKTASMPQRKGAHFT